MFSIARKIRNARLNDFFIYILLLHISLQAVGESDTLQFINDLQLGTELQYGTVIPHHKSIEYSLKNNIVGIEISVATNTYGKSAWDKIYRYPRIGAGYLLTSLGNREVFGTANAVFLFMDIPFSSRQNRICAGYQINLGLAYINRLFDVDENPLNMAISTGLNVYACFRVNTRLIINYRNELFAGFGLSHFSNGKLASPNLGINTGSFTFGYHYRITNPRHDRILDNTYDNTRKHAVELTFSGGAKTDDQITGSYYIISSLVCDYKFNLSMKYACGAGTDLFYDQALGPNMVDDDGGTYSTSDLFQIGAHGALYARYDRLHILANLGTYLYTNYYKYTRIYTRIGIRYDMNRHFFLNISLKAHYAIADYIEWGIGYRF